MAYFNGRSLKRNLEKATSLVTITQGFPRAFRPEIAISYLEYEDAGMIDNKILSLSLFYYDRKKHKAQKGDWINWPLCLLPEITKNLGKYFSPQTGELATIMEFHGSAIRIYLYKDGSDLLAMVQMFKPSYNSWEKVSCIKFDQRQVFTLISFLKCFCLSHLEAIKASCLRHQTKREKLEKKPPI